MPKKKATKKDIKKDVVDFTIDDSANAPKPVRRLKKSTAKIIPVELPWDQVDDNELDIVEEENEDGTKSLVYKKKRNNSKSEQIDDYASGTEYPEIVWYMISQYIEPEDVGRFAGINRDTYAITQRESFWMMLYKRYCGKHPRLPGRLKIEAGYKVNGLRQRVIRALYHTYDFFHNKVMQQAAQDSQPHGLVKRTCTNVWYYKKSEKWYVFFRFKKVNNVPKAETNFIDDLGRIHANPEENAQVLQVTCKKFFELPPLMGMTLSSVSVVLAQGLRYHRLHLGFNTGHHNVSRNIMPEYMLILDTVVNINVYDWWHPLYPHFETKMNLNMSDELDLPFLKKQFFS